MKTAALKLSFFNIIYGIEKMIKFDWYYIFYSLPSFILYIVFTLILIVIIICNLYNDRNLSGIIRSLSVFLCSKRGRKFSRGLILKTSLAKWSLVNYTVIFFYWLHHMMLYFDYHHYYRDQTIRDLEHCQNFNSNRVDCIKHAIVFPKRFSPPCENGPKLESYKT